MKALHIPLFLAALAFSSFAFAGMNMIKSPRTGFVLYHPEKWVATDKGIDVVNICRKEDKKNKDRVSVLIDSKGVVTVSSSAGFPLKVTVSRPSVDFPFTLIVFERQKDGLRTDLVEAVAVKSGVARFLSEDEYGTLAGTHENIPKIIDRLNQELNDLLKNHNVEQDGADQPAATPKSKPEGKKKPKQKSEGHSQ